MSPRNFARVFAREVGRDAGATSSSRRASSARAAPSRRAPPASTAVAEAAGFGSAETLRRAFLRSLRVGPAAYRSRFRSARVA